MFLSVSQPQLDQTRRVGAPLAPIARTLPRSRPKARGANILAMAAALVCPLVLLPLGKGNIAEAQIIIPPLSSGSNAAAQPIVIPPAQPNPANPSTPVFYPGTSYPGALYPNAPYPGTSYPGALYPNAPYPGTSYPGAPYPNAPYPGTSYPGTSYPNPANAPALPGYRSLFDPCTPHNSRLVGTVTYVGRLPGSPYVVAVPGDNAETLALVRTCVSDALILKTRRGNYIQAGAFPDRDNAQYLNDVLRSAGLDSRVLYVR